MLSSQRKMLILQELGSLSLKESERRWPEFRRRMQEIDDEVESEGRRQIGAFAAGFAAVVTVGAVVGLAFWPRRKGSS